MPVKNGTRDDMGISRASRAPVADRMRAGSRLPFRRREKKTLMLIPTFLW